MIVVRIDFHFFFMIFYSLTSSCAIILFSSVLSFFILMFCTSDGIFRKFFANLSSHANLIL